MPTTSSSIRKIADEGACVIVGRCADYALSEYDNCLNIVLHGDEKCTVERIMRKHDLSEQKAKEMIIKKDKQRQSYYNYYSSKKSGLVSPMPGLKFRSVIGMEFWRIFQKHFWE